ncbi:hypothetical protein B0F90DRAFT_1814122 [Multifurca ochricompacta]|uniref:Major facilitator superfamily (MFS) profile domain-containing protein n=1 Tax=Multifurca ochricompacta TaxID=376703 RepID=A0AAD4MC58_9AGAM|nr:hypothetical protein B0F90DRAFT_1814122 [Multifurca ochricompacta]
MVARREYLPENLGRAGFTTPRALLYSGACALVYCAGTVPTMFLIDKWGRRAFLLAGSCSLAGALAIIGGLQYHFNTLPLGDARVPTADGIFAALRADHGTSWGPTPWLLGAEIFPLRACAKGIALSTVSNWISNFVIVFITPPPFDAISGGYCFILLMPCVISGAVVFFVYPETAHVTLQQLSQVFGDTSMLDSEKAETGVSLHSALKQIRSTTMLQDADTDKSMLAPEDTSDRSRASSSTAIGEVLLLGTPAHANFDNPAEHYA